MQTQLVHTHRPNFGGKTTWISLPRDQWPADWHNRFTQPVVILTLNLYGHPLAGLYWEVFCHEHIKSLGFVAVIGWECLFMHVQQQLFLSIYVDDFKMAGKAENIEPMWKRISALIDLDPSVPLHGTTYLG